MWWIQIWLALIAVCQAISPVLGKVGTTAQVTHYNVPCLIFSVPGQKSKLGTKMNYLVYSVCIAISMERALGPGGGITLIRGSAQVTERSTCLVPCGSHVEPSGSEWVWLSCRGISSDGSPTTEPPAELCRRGITGGTSSGGTPASLLEEDDDTCPAQDMTHIKLI